MTRVYYAHCIKDYNTKESKRNVECLKQMGFEVIDPSEDKYGKHVEKMKAKGKTGREVMKFFCRIVKACDHLAFSFATKEKISAGVAKEIRAMLKQGGSVIQMPNLENIDEMTMTVEETRIYLKSV